MKFPEHVQNFLDNKEEVKCLVEIYTKAARTKERPKKKIEVLNKSVILLLSACWESFIESLVYSAFKYITDNTDNYEPSDPNLTLTENQLKKAIRSFHSPSTKKINDLFLQTIGIQNISKSWKWRGHSNKNAIDQLEKFMDLRNSIAHKIKTNKPIPKWQVTYYWNFINYLCVKTHNTVNGYIYQRIGIQPWDNLRIYYLSKSSDPLVKILKRQIPSVS